MDSLSQFFTSDLSLWGLFISSFLAATLLPGGSEAVLYAVLQAYPETQFSALMIATVGNTLGGMLTYAMGWLLPQQKGGSKAAGHPPVYSLRVQTHKLAHVEKLRRYGTPLLLLAWVPLLGDALCLAAGWLRLNWWQAALFMALGKFVRYWLIAITLS